MKRIPSYFLVALVLLGLLPSVGRAQGFRLGVHFDPTIRWFSSDISIFKPQGPAAGFNTGLDIEKHFAERYSVATGVNFDFSQGRITYLDTGYRLDTRYEDPLPVPRGATIATRAHYINIPLGFKMRAIEIGYTTIFATAALDSYIRVAEYATSEQLGMKRIATKNMYTPAYLGYLLRLGVEYSLGGPSAVEAGIGFNGFITPAYKTGKGRIGVYAMHLRVGFVF